MCIRDRRWRDWETGRERSQTNLTQKYYDFPRIVVKVHLDLYHKSVLAKLQLIKREGEGGREGVVKVNGRHLDG